MKILVPVDSSDVSMAGWRQAASLAEQMKAEIEAVYILPSGDEDKRQDRSLMLNRLNEEIGHGSRLRILSGNPLHVTIQMIRGVSPDLVVMGTHAHSGPAHYVLRSVAEEIIQHSPVPVLAVRPDTRPIHAIRSVLLPVAFTNYAVFGIAQATKLFASSTVSFTLAYFDTRPPAPTDPRSSLQELINRLPNGLRLRTRLMVQTSRLDAAEAILANTDHYDVVGLAFHQKNTVAGLPLRTTVERVLERSPIPVLALPYAAVASEQRQKVLAGALVS